MTNFDINTLTPLVYVESLGVQQSRVSYCSRPSAHLIKTLTIKLKH